MACLPCCFALADDYNGVKGQSISANKQTGGGIVGKCDNKKEGDRCQVNGAIKPICEYVDKKRTKLSCTARECKTGFIHHIGYGRCETEKAAQDFCKNNAKCNNDEIAVPKKLPNSSGRSGFSYKDCFCADKNMVVYDCGGGSGNPPTDKKIYTNVDEITVQNNTCEKTGTAFVGWKCGDKVLQPGDKFSIESKTTCVAQWDTNKYNVEYACGDGASGNPPSTETYDYNTTVSTQTNAGECLKTDSIFTGWDCGTSFTIQENKKCTAQWDSCEPCNPGDGCTCTLNVENNECKYMTKPNERYSITSGNNTASPQCKQVTQCPTDADGVYPDCACKDSGKKYDNSTNLCVVKCPSDSTGDYPNCKCTDTDKRYNQQQNACVDDDLEKKRKAYEDAKAKEQSLANRALTAATVAATGIGAMELAQGLSEQRADKAAAEDMAAYIATFRCDYGGGKSVKAGPDEIELPGGNNQTLMNYRAEYFALANDLKDRKTALNIKPGIESEAILDKTQLGLYDDENTGITSGAEASLYRAQMLKSESDQSKLDEASSTSQKRVKGGAIALGAGVAGGVLGDQIINGELGKKIKDAFKNKKLGTETKKLMDKENDALDDLKKCLASAGIKDTDKLEFKSFYPSVLSVKNINCAREISGKMPNGQSYSDISASDLFIDSSDATEVFNHLATCFDTNILGKLIGYVTLNNNNTDAAKRYLNRAITNVEQKFKDAEKSDKEKAVNLGINIGAVLGSGKDFGSFKDMLSNKDFMSFVGDKIDVSSISGLLNK